MLYKSVSSSRKVNLDSMKVPFESLTWSINHSCWTGFKTKSPSNYGNKSLNQTKLCCWTGNTINHTSFSYSKAM